MFIFFTPLFRFGKEATKAEPADRRKAIEVMKKQVFLKQFSDNRLKKVLQYVEVMSKANRSFKIGTLIAQLINHQNAFKTKKNELLSFTQEINKVDDRIIHRTECRIGTNYSNKIRTLNYGPILEISRRKLMDTRNDCIETKERAKLKFHHGANQRNFCFLSEKTFLKFSDLDTLMGNYKKLNNKLTDNLESSMLRIHNPNLSEIDSTIKKFKNQKTANVTKYYAALLQTKFNIEITNMTSGHASNVSIHLLEFTDSAIDRNEATIDKLIDNLQYKKPDFKTKKNWNSDRQKHILKRIPPENIKKITGNNEFSKQLITNLDCDVTGLDVFKKEVKILQTWTKCLKPSSKWNFTFKRIFEKGIFLNKIHESSHAAMNTPIEPFIMIESYGDAKALLVRRSDNESFNVYGPSQHQFEAQFEVKYLSKSTHPDIMYEFLENTQNNEFLDREKSMEYYPNRKEKFNVDIEEINQSARGKLPYYLVQPESNNITIEVGQVEKALNSLRNDFPGEKDLTNLTNEDATFIDFEKLNQTEITNETESEIENENPYGEWDEHDTPYGEWDEH